MSEDKYRAALDMAAKQLSYRALSAKMLRDKLLAKGHDEEAADYALAWLTERSMLNDELFAESVVRSYTRKGYGAARIRQELTRRGIDREEVAHVEASDKLHADLLAVDLEVHSLEVALQDARPVVGHALDGVGLDARLAVLHHEESVLVVSVGDGEGRLRQHVEEHLLGVAVVFERLVIVQVVSREVGEESARKVESADSVLMDGVGGALHEAIRTSCADHARQ